MMPVYILVCKLQIVQDCHPNDQWQKACLHPQASETYIYIFYIFIEKQPLSRWYPAKRALHAMLTHGR